MMQEKQRNAPQSLLRAPFTMMITTIWLQVIILLIALTAFAPLATSKSRTKGRLWPAALGNATAAQEEEEVAEKALFGMGCFWGPQHVFHSLAGVLSATTGYADIGDILSLSKSRPSAYLSVCAGDGRTEAVMVEFLPSTISYERLLRVFWKHHDSTTKQRPQYRSVLWPLNENQKRIAEQSLSTAREMVNVPRTIIAEAPPRIFYVAESVHQHFWTKFRLKAACLGAGAVFGVTSLQDEFVTDATVKLVLLWVLWEGLELVFKGARSLCWHYPFRKENHIKL
jgi:peptide-methionine (S)-S-oxide reductase